VRRERWIAPRDVVGLACVCLLALTEPSPLRPLRRVAARFLGAAAFRFSRRKRRRIEANLKACFGRAMSTARRRRIARTVFRETWREILDAPRTGPAPVVIRGLENVRWALDAGRGAILWESHGLGRRMLAKRVLGEHGVRIFQVHDVHHLGGVGGDERVASWIGRRLLRPFFDRRERRSVEEILHLPDGGSLVYARELVARLRGNRLVCVAGDGPLGHRRVEIEFLGGWASFATGTISLSRLTGSPLLPLFCLELPSGDVELTVEAPLALEPGRGRDGELSVARRYARLLEARILGAPGQYRSWHTVQTGSGGAYPPPPSSLDDLPASRAKKRSATRAGSPESVAGSDPMLSQSPGR